MSPSTFDLSDLFDAALQAVIAHRQEINALDDYNGNHGDHVVANLRLMTEVLGARRAQPPSDALRGASRALRSQGRGSTSQYYANALSQAADQLQGHTALDRSDVLCLAQLLLSTIPAGETGQEPEGDDSILDHVMGMISGQPLPGRPQCDGSDAANGPGALLPAGVAFLQAQQAGLDLSSAARQAVIGALMGGHVDPLQAGVPHAAAGGLVAQGLLQAVSRRRSSGSTRTRA